MWYSYCLYFFYLMEQMNYYDTILKIYFGLNEDSLESSVF